MTNRGISHDPHHQHRSQAGIDWTKPVLWLFAAVLIALIVLPMSWLAVYASPTAPGIRRCRISSPCSPIPDFLDPLFETSDHRHHVRFICCLVAARSVWLVSRTDMPARQFIRALVTASFVTPPFLRAVGLGIVARPTAAADQLYRF